MKKYRLVVAMVLCVLLTTVGLAYGQGAAGGHVVKKNRAGGVSAVGAHGVKGASGAAGGTHAVASDGQGNVAGGSAQGFKTKNAKGARAGGFTRTSDGAVQHKSGMAATGTKGTVTSSGSTTKSAQGDVTGQRSTSATSTSGATYQGSTSYDKGSGVSHTGTCKDASGNEVPCPKK